MSAIVFPPSPSVNDIFSAAGRSWIWTGSVWNIYSSLSAASVGNVPAGSITATEVQAALNELDTEKAALAGGTFTGNLTLNGTANTAPNQTAASGSSLMTRDLGDDRYRRDPWGLARRAPLALSATANAAAAVGSEFFDYVLTLTPAASVAGNYARALVSGFLNSGGFGGGGGTVTNSSWTIVFDASYNYYPTNTRMGVIIGPSGATSLVPAARAFSFRITASSTATLGIHDGATETTASITVPAAAWIVRYSLRWNHATNTLSLVYDKSDGLGPVLAGSVTAAPGATTLSGRVLTFLYEATGTVSAGPAAQFSMSQPAMYAGVLPY